jgi:hypothetical protein
MNVIALHQEFWLNSMVCLCEGAGNSYGIQQQAYVSDANFTVRVNVFCEQLP